MMTFMKQEQKMKGRKKIVLYKVHYAQKNLQGEKDVSSSHDLKSKQQISTRRDEAKHLMIKKNMCVNEQLNCPKSSTLSAHSSKTELSDVMANFFLDKVKKI